MRLQGCYIARFIFLSAITITRSIVASCVSGTAEENCLGTYIITIYKECTGKPQGNLMALPYKALPYLFSPVMYIHNSASQNYFVNRALQIGITGLLLQATIIVLLRVSDNIHSNPTTVKKKKKKNLITRVLENVDNLGSP